MDDLRKKIQTDPYLNFLGIELEELSDGFAICSLSLSKDMVNFMGVPHGGLLFSLADAALSAASNSDHYPSYAIEVNGSFLAKVSIGDTLTAKSVRIHQTHKTAVYKMEIFHLEKIIAVFRGTVYRSKK
jgi:acyl-CoA thioesterase